MVLHLTSIDISPPPRLGEVEAFVRASNAPGVLLVDRDLMRGLLDYLRRLERETGREGSFW
jgi:hypothetical protein